MKILRVSSDLYPSIIGGATLHVHSMSRLQVKFGNQVTVYTSKHDDKPDTENVDGYMVFRFKPLIKVYGNAIMPGLFFRLMANKNAYDVIHAHSHVYFSTNVCALVRKFRSSPLVITMHGLISATTPGWLSNMYQRSLGLWTLNAADRIICYTEEEKVEMIKIGVDREKICVIHNGTDTDLFKPSDKPRSFNRILFIGRLVPGKGANYLVDAFALALKSRLDLTLTMIGNGPLLATIKEKVSRLGIEDRVTIKERVLNEEMPTIYQNSDLFILPSLSEGVPRSILEAMSCGLPVICTDLPQLKSLVDGCGMMVSAKDSRALADAILKILSGTRLAEELGAHGRERVLQSYSWEDTVRKTVMLYGEIIASRRDHYYKSERSDAHSSRRPL